MVETEMIRARAVVKGYPTELQEEAASSSTLVFPFPSLWHDVS